MDKELIMRQLDEYILEKLVLSKDVKVTYDDVDANKLKNMIKKNGYSVPATFKFDENRQKLIYSANSGHRGDKVLGSIKEKLEAAGWKSLKKFNKDKAKPDGSWVEYLSTYLSPDKKVVFHSDRFFGETSRENKYSGEFETTENFSVSLSLDNTINDMKPLLVKCGLNDWKDNFKDCYTYKNDIYSWTYEKILSYLGKSDNNTWEKMGFIITCKPIDNRKYELTITYKEKPKQIEIDFD